MPGTVLITGGAGFIGCHLARALLERGYNLRVVDNLIDQVHGQCPAEGLDQDVEFLKGDIRDADVIRRALAGVDKVVHLAAEIGVGQSMYAVDRYVSVNDYGTAVLFQQLIDSPVRRVVVASSMSIYGEGLYRTEDGDLVEDAVRMPRAGKNLSWDPLDPMGRPLTPVPTPEWKRASIASVYALTKFMQERLTLTIAPAYGMEGVALRLWNVYGPGQALSNPYTGVLAIFASRFRNGAPPVIFEDGHQRRDFVQVRDVANAFVLALEHPRAAGGVYNIASGEHRSVRDVARDLAKAMNVSIEPVFSGKARTGDIRHCIADIGKARMELGFAPRCDFVEGLTELAEWVGRNRALDRVAESCRELEVRGLVA